MLFQRSSAVVGLLASVASVSALPAEISKREVIGHDEVVGFPETVPDGLVGTLMLKYKPYLKVNNGCTPFPAVDADGNTSGGLDTSGDPNGGCDSSLGQVYARAGPHEDKYGIMYSWYFPKDSPGPELGHRHDWENVVVWLSEESEVANVTGVAISAHGSYDKVGGHFSGDRPLIGYASAFPVNHQLIDTEDQGGEQPMIAWESMTEAARLAMDTTDFRSATASFREANFTLAMTDAYF